MRRVICLERNIAEIDEALCVWSRALTPIVGARHDDSMSAEPPEVRFGEMKPLEAKLALPPYPAGPASLMAAQVFYNAARQEINERCKFRDQVVITVIGATTGFIGFVDPARIGHGFDGHRGYPTVLDGGLSLLIATVLLGVMSVFLARYLGYQNLKIAELGFYITSAPAYHFQLYATHQLDVDVIADPKTLSRREFERLGRLVPLLSESLGHWDRWARRAEQDNARARRPFSLEGVAGFLITSFSCLGLALVAVAVARVAAAPVQNTSTPIDWVMWGVTVALATFIPIRTSSLLAEGANLKKAYQTKRDQHPDPSAPVKSPEAKHG